MRALPVPLWRASGIARRQLHRLIGPRAADRAKTAQIVAQIAAKKGPIKVAFVVCSPAKWSMQTLFNGLVADSGFTPAFYPTVSDAGLRLSRAERAAEFAKTRAFFSNIGTIADDLYVSTSDRMKTANAIEADVVFIQQPWGMQDLPRQLAGCALPAYVHYGYPVIRNEGMQFGLPDFHPFLWCHFVPDDTQADAMRSSGHTQAQHMPVTGHPKLDAYLTPEPARNTVTAWPNPDDLHRKRVIFAPHHTLGANSLNLATFEWSGPAMLELVQTHPEIDFILKPHPNLGYEMSRAATHLSDVYDSVLQGWHDAPNANVMTGGDYFDVFRTSDLMITDSGSFLAEYLPSKQPLIRLTKSGSASLNKSGQALADSFYSAASAEALHQAFDQILLQGDDPLVSQRETAAARILPNSRPSAQRVIDYLRAAFRPEVSGEEPNVGSKTGASDFGR